MQRSRPRFEWVALCAVVLVLLNLAGVAYNEWVVAGENTEDMTVLHHKDSIVNKYFIKMGMVWTMASMSVYLVVMMVAGRADVLDSVAHLVGTWVYWYLFDLLRPNLIPLSGHCFILTHCCLVMAVAMHALSFGRNHWLQTLLMLVQLVLTCMWAVSLVVTATSHWHTTQEKILGQVLGLGYGLLTTCTLWSRSPAARQVFEAIEKEKDAHLETLVDNGAPVNATREGGETPLHLACKNGNMEATRVLLEGGAKGNVTDDQGRSPMHFAATHSVALVKLLRSNGVNVTGPEDLNGDVPLSMALRHAKQSITVYMKEQCQASWPLMEDSNR